MKLKKVNLNIGAKIFKALSDDSRLRILYLIFTNEEMCISDIEQILNFTQTKTSRHITYLKNSGILKQNKSDQWVYYSIKEQYSGIVETMLHMIEKDEILEEDQKNFNVLYSNNELAIRKKHNKEIKYKIKYL